MAGSEEFLLPLMNLSGLDRLDCFSFVVFKRFYSSKPGFNKFTNNYKNEYELTVEQKEALVGIVLADGSLERAKPTHNTRLRVEQTYPEQKAYLLNISKLFAPLIKTEPTIVTRKADSRTGKVYQAISAKTLSFPCFNFYHDLFYPPRSSPMVFGPGSKD